ncbi:MAG: c-type cytochrome [Hyphomicrobiaceae bacterium]
MLPRTFRPLGARTRASVARLAVLSAAMLLAPCVSETRAADEVDGETAFNNACRTCHSVKKDDNRLGPNLHGIVGRKAGAAEGFSYSGALRDGSFSWDEEKLDAFIANPDKAVPGNTMKPFSGVADEATRNAIINFLKGA